MLKTLPPRPNLEHLRKEAKLLHRSYASQDEEAIRKVKFFSTDPRPIAPSDFRLHDAQTITARQYGFLTWPRLKREVQRKLALQDGPDSLLLLACQGPLFGVEPGTEQYEAARARRILDQRPEISSRDIYTACACADFDFVHRELDRDPQLARVPGGPKEWPLLLYLCFSNLVNSTPVRASSAIRIGHLLIEKGADPNASWMHRWLDQETRLTALYGAIGCANLPALTELLLKAGARPDDPNTVYRATGFPDSRHLQLLLAHGAKVPDHIGLLRKLLYDDLEGLRLMLEHGADPNHLGPQGTALHAAIRQGRGADYCRVLLDFGADPQARTRAGLTPFQLATRLGNTSAAGFLRERNFNQRLTDRESFLAACMRGDKSEALAILSQAPDLPASLGNSDWGLLEHAASAGKLPAVRLMLELGFPPKWDSARAAAVAGQPEILKLLIDAGAPLELQDPDFEVSLIDSALFGFGVSIENQPPGRVQDYTSIVRILLAAGVKPIDEIPETLPEPLFSLLR